MSEHDTPAISLCVTTIGRPDHLTRLVRSLAVEAATSSFELIVTDQSTDQSAAAVLSAQVRGFRWRVTTSARGAARGRNAALALASAPLVTFPDDDCWYPGTTLQRMAAVLDEHPTWAGVSGMMQTGEGRPNMLRWATKEQSVELKNYYRTSIGPTFMARTALAREVGGFNDRVGVGSGTKIGACEDSDLILRIAQRGEFRYRPDLVVHHDPIAAPESTLPEKMYSYGLGDAWFWRTAEFPRARRGVLIGRKMAKIGVNTLRGKRAAAAVDRAYLRGVLEGLSGRVQFEP